MAWILDNDDDFMCNHDVQCTEDDWRHEEDQHHQEAHGVLYEVPAVLILISHRVQIENIPNQNGPTDGLLVRNFAIHRFRQNRQLDEQADQLGSVSPDSTYALAKPRGEIGQRGEEREPNAELEDLIPVIPTGISVQHENPPDLQIEAEPEDSDEQLQHCITIAPEEGLGALPDQVVRDQNSVD